MMATQAPRRLTGPSPVSRVLLAIRSYADHQRNMIRGVLRYARMHDPPWELVFRKSSESPADMVRQTRGIHAVLLNPAGGLKAEEQAAAALGRRKLPGVFIEAYYTDRYPTVNGDNRAIGALAFEHLRSKGFTNYAYVGPNSGLFRERGEAFAERVMADGQRRLETWWFETFDIDRNPKLRRLILKAPKPVAIFAGNADLARHVLIACRKAGVKVPEEIAVLGVDNEELDCELAQPPLSTIDHGMEQAGFEAAAWLRRLMEGHAAPEAPILVPPIGVIERQSTDTFAIEDPDVQSAVRLIRERATLGLGVKELLELLPVSRRKLEIGFRRSLGRSIHAELTRVRLDRAKFLLRTTDLAMPQIATASGFTYPSHLSGLFVHVEGMTPTAYRRQQRGDGRSA